MRRHRPSSRWDLAYVPAGVQKWFSVAIVRCEPARCRVRLPPFLALTYLGVLSPIWSEKRATALKAREFLRALFDHAKDAGYLSTNLVGKVLADALPRARKKQTHFPAAPPIKVVSVLHAVDRSDASAATKLSLRFQVLTDARLGEVRDARRSHIDRKQRVWAVPADRMKSGEAHAVPLSSQALAVLDEAWLLGGANDLVFPSLRGGMLSDGTHSKLVRQLGFDWVPHGFRTSFRTWCAMNKIPREVAEAGEAHVVGNLVERAYSRSDLFERRRPVMQAWADYLGEQ